MYSYKNEQKKLDEIKWKESIEAGADKCGTYEYCSVCVKAEEFPCAKAKRRAANKTCGKTRVAVVKA